MKHMPQTSFVVVEAFISIVARLPDCSDCLLWRYIGKRCEIRIVCIADIYKRRRYLGTAIKPMRQTSHKSTSKRHEIQGEKLGKKLIKQPCSGKRFVLSSQTLQNMITLIALVRSLSSNVHIPKLLANTLLLQESVTNRRGTCPTRLHRREPREFLYLP